MSRRTAPPVNQAGKDSGPVFRRPVLNRRRGSGDCPTASHAFCLILVFHDNFRRAELLAQGDAALCLAPLLDGVQMRPDAV